MGNTKIGWTEKTWNPMTGCSKLSAGCTNCYAASMAIRLNKMGSEKYRNEFNPTFHSKVLGEPKRWSKPSMIFVNSMSDTFHEKFTDAQIGLLWDIMRDCPQHTFQILTKRSERMRDFVKGYGILPNVWLGVTVENQTTLKRIRDLGEILSTVRFISCEPLLGPLPNLDLTIVDWVIVGGESGPRARPIEKDWVRGIRNKCQIFNVPFFFKQWGGMGRNKGGCVLDGEVWKQYPLIGKEPDQQRLPF